jgi:succinyl-diaminopimelate desuccinylase
MDRMTTQALLETIDDRFNAEVEFLVALVRTPSDNPPGDCAGHADLGAGSARL